jgi:hypothetical protein
MASWRITPLIMKTAPTPPRSLDVWQSAATMVNRGERIFAPLRQ